LIRRPTQDASVAVLCAKFRLSLVSDEVACGVEPLGALLALDDELTFVVR
jgi:adenosylmethionine-8-amino-7-oxononanoate aminotransferase